MDIREAKNFSRVMDIKVEVTIQLGSCELPMREIVELTPGAVLQLKQNAKEPVALLVNGKLIAYGEVVVVENNFGVKITELVGDANA
ncbi:MAG: flagellar motor switch protein FliN/FliY [Puniceicoccaceae bacterium 5H]|nr:MAG: flagellar motor switch protein FliN/FliY [Puniceicoccaceae bacterium 5H]